MTVRLLHGDCRDVLRTLADGSVHAIVTDPPYHLTQASRGGHARTNSPESPHGRHRIGDKGFMGQMWDGGDVAFQPETWAQCLRVLRPGGFLIAFGGTRTYHRLVCAIEDGGFEVRDMLAWLYGSGFPKGTDKAKIPEAWRGWNTALKPAIEPICLARKPMDGTLAQNLERWGTGALWVDGCRIPLDGDDTGGWGDGRRPGGFGDVGAERGDSRPNGQRHDAGRWPANVLHDGSEEVVALFPSEAGAAAPVHRRNADKFRGTYGAFKGNVDEAGSTFKGDSGSAARFFYCAKADRADRNEGLMGMPERVIGVLGDLSDGKKSTLPRANHHPTVKPTDLMRWLVRLVTPPGGMLLDPFLGSGSTLKAAELEGFDGIGIEREAEYIEIARRRIAGDAPLFAEVA